VIFERKICFGDRRRGFYRLESLRRIDKNRNVICLDDFSTGDEKTSIIYFPNKFRIRQTMILPTGRFDQLSGIKKISRSQFQGIQEIYHLACRCSPKDFEKNKIATLWQRSYGVKNGLI